MADIYSVRQTTDNTGGAIAAGYAGANAKKIGTASVDNFGTRTLSFLKVAGTLSAAAVNISSEAFRGAVYQGVSIYAEIYGIGATDGSSPYDVTFIVAEDTANGADSGNTQATTFGLMEAAILSAVNGVTASTLDAVVVTRYAGFTGDILA
jgi:hypothetical protein